MKRHENENVTEWDRWSDQDGSISICRAVPSFSQQYPDLRSMWACFSRVPNHWKPSNRKHFDHGLISKERYACLLWLIASLLQKQLKVSHQISGGWSIDNLGPGAVIGPHDIDKNLSKCPTLSIYCKIYDFMVPMSVSSLALYAHAKKWAQ